MIIGCDFHTLYQQIALMDEGRGELAERLLDHESGEAHTFHRNLQGPVRARAPHPLAWRGSALQAQKKRRSFRVLNDPRSPSLFAGI